MTESGNGNKCFMFTLWRCAEWQLCNWMCLLWNRVAFAPTPAFHFLSNVLNVVLQVWFLLQWKRAWPGLPNRISVPVVHPVSKYSLWTDCLGGERADCFTSVMNGHWSEVSSPVVSQGHTWTNCQCSDGQYSWIGIVLFYCRNQHFSAFSLDTVTTHPPLFAQFWYITDVCKDSGSSVGPGPNPYRQAHPAEKQNLTQ